MLAQALEKLSQEHPQAVLRQGGLVAVLSYLDFFQTGVQRTAVHTAATMCRALSLDNLEPVATAVPILTNILQYPVRPSWPRTGCHMPPLLACSQKSSSCV